MGDVVRFWARRLRGDAVMSWNGIARPQYIKDCRDIIFAILEPNSCLFAAAQEKMCDLQTIEQKSNIDQITSDEPVVTAEPSVLPT